MHLSNGRYFQSGKVCFTQSQKWLLILGGGTFAACFLAAPGLAADSANRILQIGIIQRFGSQSTDEITLKATAGNKLTVQFKTGNKAQTLTTSEVKLSIVMQPLPAPVVQERVVLSTNRSFESAEDSADRWRARGIEVEIAQPGRWQVWGKREVYASPFLRRMLLESVQLQDDRNPYLDTQTVQQQPKVSWVVNGFRYSREQLEVTAGNNLIQITQKVRDDRNTRLYAGSLRLQPNAYGTYTLVNPVPIETYLRGVVPHEIGIGAPPTAIEAQAILARTYVLRNLRRFAIDNYELCADTQCQVYFGLGGVNPKTDRAISVTQGLVLTYQNELVDALYSSTTGGVTAAFTDVWNGTDRPYLRPVVDSVASIWDLSRQSLANEKNLRAFIGRRQGFNEVGWDMFRWRFSSTLPEITQQLREYLRGIKSPMATIQTVQAVQVVKRSAAGRVLKVAIKTDRGTIEIEKDNILNALYAPTSTLFYLDPLYNPDKTLRGYTFVGGGMGHGVGLSQTGSYRLGELGWSNQRILSFYYPGTELKTISPSITFWKGNPIAP